MMTADFAEGADILGQVSLQGRTVPAPDPSYGITVTISLLNPGTSNVLMTQTVTTGYSAHLTTAGLLAGTYDALAKGSHTLSRRLSGVTLAIGDNLLDWGTRGMLREGDANNGNVVSIVDFSLLRSTFGKGNGYAGYDARADFNQDGWVGLLDFSILRSNFGQAGE